MEKNSPDEDVPLHSPPSSDNHDTKTKSFFPGLFLNKTKVIVLGVVLLILLIIIIILAALLGKANAKLGEDKHGKGHVDKGPTSSPGPAPTTPGSEAWWRVRLPDDVIPLHYNLLMNLTVDQPRFNGKVEISVNVTKPTNLILVHANTLNVSHVAVRSISGKGDLEIKRHFWFEKNQFYVIEMGSSLTTGLYAVKMSFAGFFAGDLRGLYRSTFQKTDGKLINFAATQFEPVRARTAFPCFDEPALKATFNVTIAHRPDYIALSNMPIYRTDETGGQKYDYFGKTVILPTYLIAFVVGDFQYEEITTKNKVKMRVYSRPAIIDTTAYGARIGSDLLTFFEGYFKVKYPLPKIDMIGLPDFGPGAMENWGLVIYRERYLLYDRRQASERDKATVARIITHELAHQWFGNIATMRWWDDLWLNEAFATYMVYVGVADVEPSWDEGQNFIGTTNTAMTLDGLMTSHPVKVPVNSPDEIGEIFDSISYQKGASILRMLDYILGNETFADGLTKYLIKHAYSNAETDDLWEALKQASCARGSCVDVKNIMDTWTLQMGFPVVTIKKTGSTYSVTQKHFLYDPKADVSKSKYKSPFNYTWYIPFSYITSKQPIKPKSAWMAKNSTSFISDGSTWIKGNHGNKGYYLVNYENSNWDALAKQLNQDHTVLGVADRTGLIFDSFNLAKGSQLNYTKAFALTEYLGKEDAYPPWNAMKIVVKYLQMVLPKFSQAYIHLQKYLVHQGRAQYTKLGFQDVGNHLQIYKRDIFLDIFCKAGVATCVNNATSMFKKWMGNPKSYMVPANLRSFVYYQGVATGGEREWDFLYDQYIKSNSASDQKKMITALAAAKESWLLARYLKYSLDPLKFKKSVTMFIVEAVANDNPSARTLTWDFVRMNWDQISAIFGSTTRAYARIVPKVTKGFSAKFELQELIEFNAKITAIAGYESKAQTQAVETVKSNIAWIQGNKNTVESWLAGFIKRNNFK